MKSIKWIFLTGMIALLAACGGTGYEGNYEATGPGGSMALTIEGDHFIMDGNKVEFVESSVREQGEKRWLVFSLANGKEEKLAIDQEGNLVVDLKWRKIVFKPA